jgi:hypothetical protein
MSRAYPYALVLLSALCGCSNHVHAAAATAQEPLVDAELIYADYQDSVAAAEKKYRGHAVLVTGRMQRVTTTANAATMDLKAADPARPVPTRLRVQQPCNDDPHRQCTAAQALQPLLRGAKVYLDCQVGDTVKGLPDLHDCTLMPARFKPGAS